ncbi:hypothetical protein P3T73_03220 [Kiritimatiellota bacterium B12222]|nr:hypothetical protein P3T73_03220 [Kiritimatiellota bacterium B12222]
MKKSARKRSKVIGRGSSSFSRSTLYLMGDHILKLEGQFTETYRRFYFKDLQSAYWIKNRGSLWAMIIFILLFIAIAIPFFINDLPGVAAFPAGIALLATIYLLFIQATGGYVHFYLSTPAQEERIREIKTQRKARKILRLIESHIERSQSDHDHSIS